MHMDTAEVVDLQELSLSEKRGGREGRQCARACLHCISPPSITSNRKVIDHESRAEPGRAERRAATPASMRTTLDMLIQPTCSHTSGQTKAAQSEAVLHEGDESSRKPGMSASKHVRTEVEVETGVNFA